MDWHNDFKETLFKVSRHLLPNALPKNLSIYLQNGEQVRLTQDDIDKRSVIFTTLVDHPSRLIKSVLQNAIETPFGFYQAYSNGQMITIKAKPVSTLNYKKQGQIQYVDKNVIKKNNLFFPTDIIELFAMNKKITYSEAINEIYTHITVNKILYPQRQKDSIKLKQEKNPIALYGIDFLEQFNQSFPFQCESIHTYYNEFGSYIGTCFSGTNNGKNVFLYYTLWRSKNSPMLFLLPKAPEPPYMIYNAQNMQPNTIAVLENEREADEQGVRGHVCISIPFGIHNLDKADFEQLKNKTLLLEYKKNYFHENFLIRLEEVAHKHNTKIEFIADNDNKYTIAEVRKDSTYFIPSPISFGSDGNTVSGFSDKGTSIKNYNRKRESIVEPIIKEGNMVWLFAKEKVGKTLVGLTLAYIISKGNRTFGPWVSCEPKNVLYIDGEMPGDAIYNLLSMIMNGYNDNSDPTSTPFATYLFAEEGLDYDSILDEEWFAEHGKKLFAYDVVILDNYYSLNENRINVKPFIKLLKKITGKNITVIVLDHTNSDNELQGSAVKKRTADLGIRLDGVDRNSFDLSFEFDRYGVANNVGKVRFEKVFVGESLQLIAQQTQPASTEEQAVKAQTLTPRDYSYLYCYLANEKYGIIQEEVGAKIGKKMNTVCNYINAVKATLAGKEATRNKISNPELFLQEYEKLKDISKEEIFEALETFKK